MKKFMVALTGLVTLATVGAAMPAPTLTANAAKKTSSYVSPSLSVNKIYSNSKKITGKATKGSKITVKKTKHAKKNLATATASKKTGKYTAKLSKTLKKNSNVYVYARNPKTKAYFYRIIRVQAASTKAATKKTTKKTTTKKSTKKSTKTASFSVKTPTGTWKSNTANKYSQVFVFSQKKGFNQTLYKNGKKVKKLVSYATYKVTPKTKTFWKITYTRHNKKGSFYMRFTSAKKFKIVNSKNHVIKTKAGVAPAAKWTFTKK
ncbi:hypothetical protein H3M12_02385 [Levilactobacillus suantsaii]|uniref:Ig-like domain-containing protein n=1 Tax=Levilactobacillus suantsaii TaxID=2292255 RepID=UPI0015F44962|nr:Ig-like domain-containing protein [Levilactobacillus suantsaii]QMU08545.1 hypothetical protein H3M12_02385 [Levilactobacillus suantsaii]